MKPWLKNTLLLVGALLLLSQLIPIDRSVPTVAAENDFLVATNAPPVMADLISNACYDCHSYQSEYPWYAKIAPLSFWIQGHINGGREHLNFSDWTSYSAKKAAHKLEEAAEEVQDRHMPLKSYTWLHQEADMTDEQVMALAQWLESTMNTIE